MTTIEYCGVKTNEYSGGKKDFFKKKGIVGVTYENNIKFYYF